MSVLLPSKPVRINQASSGSGGPSDLIYGDSGIYVRDVANDASIQFNINGSTALNIDKFKRLGINTQHVLTYRLEINDPDGDCIRMFKNNELPASIRNENGWISFNTFDESQTGVALPSKIRYGGVNIDSTAVQLNYTNVAEPGLAQRGKCLVLDSDKSAYGIKILSVEDLIVNNSMTLDMNSDRYVLNVKNQTGKCLKFYNNELFTEFTLQDSGELTIFNSGGHAEIICNSDVQYPLQMTSNGGNGIGIKFNSYSQSIKRNMSSIETEMENGMQSSVIRFNNMKNGSLHNTVTIRSDGNIVCNSVLELSDKRRKTIIKPSDMEESLKKIKQIQIYDFVYKGDSVLHRGLMAQELKQVIPSAVVSGDNLVISNKEIIGYLIDSIKCLAQKIEELTA